MKSAPPQIRSLPKSREETMPFARSSLAGRFAMFQRPASKAWPANFTSASNILNLLVAADVRRLQLWMNPQLIPQSPLRTPHWKNPRVRKCLSNLAHPSRQNGEENSAHFRATEPRANKLFSREFQKRFRRSS